ncbi:MAG TPA: hypothetical protein VER37_06105, partial [Thermomicrobiales bacterium]|nr:hypothetical protein [Thermomicrobiales bacterium]
AIEAGVPRERVHFLENGVVLEVTPESVGIAGKVEAGAVYVDGGRVGEVGDVVVRDRRALARNGVLLVTVGVDRETGRIVGGPELATRGFVHVGESGDLLEATKARVREELGASGANGEDRGVLSRRLRDLTSQFLYRETGRRPMVLPVVVEVEGG